MAAPAWGQGSDWLESMRNTVVDLIAIFVLREGSQYQNKRKPEALTYHISVRLAHTLSNDLVVALLVAGVSAVFALHAKTFEQELLTECAEHDSVELLLNELVSILLEDLFFALSNGTLTS